MIEYVMVEDAANNELFLLLGSQKSRILKALSGGELLIY